MPDNIEIKAKISSVEETCQKAMAISHEHYRLMQKDTFFNSPTGARLKLRREMKFKDLEMTMRNEILEDVSARVVLIAYDRRDTTGPKVSHYIMTHVEEGDEMEELLGMSNGTIGKVAKKRFVYMAQRNGLTARLHIDEVADLGNFFEFEIILNNETELPTGHEFAEYLREYFCIPDSDLIPGAYLDLLPDN